MARDRDPSARTHASARSAYGAGIRLGWTGARRALRHRPIAIAFGLWLVLTCVYLLSAGPERLSGHTPYNHYALLADAWLDGRLDLGGPPPAYTGNNDFAAYDGKVYVSFPPFPAALMVPLVAISGGADQVRDGLVWVSLAGIGPAFLWLTLHELRRRQRLRILPRDALGLALTLGLGTVYWFSAVQGTVWFAGHVVGTSALCVFLWASVGCARPGIAGMALAAAMATRPSLAFAAPFFAYELWRSYRDDRTRPLGGAMIRFALPLVAVGLALCAHNLARFGDAFEFGHRHLAIRWQARIQRWGLFHWHYLGRNLAVMLAGMPFSGTADVPFRISGHGLALWLTTPAYLWLMVPRRRTALYVVALACAAAVALPSLLYQNSGWIQFGYRFSNDFAPLLLLGVAGAHPHLRGRRRACRSHRIGRRIFWVSVLFGVVVNGFGAASFGRAAYRPYYAIDPTQRTLFEPD